MGTVTAYNMASIQSALGGSNPIGLNEYYRGGSYVPTTGTAAVREPTTGQYYQVTGTGALWVWYDGYGASNPNTSIIWEYTNVYDGARLPLTSYTSGIYTYFPGTLVYNDTKFSVGQYGIYRTYNSSSAINTGVPSSGTISIANLYGAQNP